jgi:hypothetical protein
VAVVADIVVLIQAVLQQLVVALVEVVMVVQAKMQQQILAVAVAVAMLVLT